jgi:hypothetical protein
MQWTRSVPGEKMLTAASQPFTSIYYHESVKPYYHVIEKMTVTKLFQCHIDLQ